jgi:hypothetical protein
VSASFIVGWRLAELYDRDELPPPRPVLSDAPLPAHLPGASEMSGHEQASVILEQARAALTALATAVGVELPGLDSVRAALDHPNHHRDDVRREVHAAYGDIQGRLAAVTPPAATACGLGRLLADTALLPRSGKPEIVLERFDPYARSPPSMQPHPPFRKPPCTVLTRPRRFCGRHGATATLLLHASRGGMRRSYRAALGSLVGDEQPLVMLEM